MSKELEEGSDLKLDFDKLAKAAKCPGVLPCAVQSVDMTGKVTWKGCASSWIPEPTVG